MGSAMASLSPVARDQWGMVTAAHARRLGVSRVDLNRQRWHVRARIWGATGVSADWRAGGSGPGPGARGLVAARKGPAVGRASPRRGRRGQPSQRRTRSQFG